MEQKYACQALREASAEISAMTAGDAGSERFMRWQDEAVAALVVLAGEDSPDVTQFRHIIFRAGTAADCKAAKERLWQAGKELAKQIVCDALDKAERAESRSGQAGSEACVASPQAAHD